MKFFGKVLLIALLFANIGFANAQKYSIEAGYMNPARTKTNHGEKYPEYFYGVRLGGNVEFDLKHNFSLLSGVLYSVVWNSTTQKHYNSDSDSLTTGIVTRQSLGHYLDIPVRVQYTVPLAKNLRMFGFAGPNFNIGLAHPRKTDASLQASVIDLLERQKREVPISGNDDLFRDALIHRINFQLGAGGGIQWKNYTLKGGYDFGINDINRNNTDRMLQSGWYVSFVYGF
jgi:hypothetical protein